MMIIETTSTNSLARIRRTRLGTAARVVRIAPDVYSLEMKSAPIPPPANSANTVPPRLDETGSKVNCWPMGMVAQWLRINQVPG